MKSALRFNLLGLARGQATMTSRLGPAISRWRVSNFQGIPSREGKRQEGLGLVCLLYQTDESTGPWIPYLYNGDNFTISFV